MNCRWRCNVLKTPVTFLRASSVHLSYRRFDTPDRIQYLFVVSLPNATAEQLGMPTGSQRDNSLAGEGTPWMMRSGTSGAHLMIPVNGTEYSN